MSNSNIGKSEIRKDLYDKLTGRAKYVSDINLPDMIFGKILRSPHAHAKIISIDTSDAEKYPGVRAVITPFNIPDGKIAPDLSILDKTVRFVGDEVAAVAADDEEIALKALSFINVEYEILPFVTSMADAISPGAPKIHKDGNLVNGKPITLERGNVEEGFDQSDRIFEQAFSTPAHSGSALEPRAALARWKDDSLTVWKSSRGVHADRFNISNALGVPKALVRVIGPTMGAGYGNKDETPLSVICALLSQRAKKPVKIEFTREEEFIAGRKRHATNTTIKVGVKNDGSITAIHASTLMDTGAYLSSGPGVIRRSGQGALYLYRCANVRFDGYLIYTNQPTAGSYRALGAPQGHFALESIMDDIAQNLSIDPLEFRLKNHVRIEGQPGERITPIDTIIDTQPVEGGLPFSSNGLNECLLKGAEAFGWKHRKQKQTNSGPTRRGVGIGMFIYRGGPGGKSTVSLELKNDGRIELISGIMDVGEGSSTVIPQIVGEVLGVATEHINPIFGDTELTPESPITAGSSVTFSTGLAAQKSALDLKSKILGFAATLTDNKAEILEIKDGFIINKLDNVHIISLAELAKSDFSKNLISQSSVLPGSKDAIINSFGVHFAEVQVDTETGQIKILKYVAAHDSGKILNPTLSINQVEGGISQMIGFALTEEILTDPQSGTTLNANYLEHKSPTIQEYPPVEVIFSNVVDPVGPFGAKALGELPSIGVAPAIMNAIFDATGIRITDLPATPDKIINAFQKTIGESS